MNRASSHDMQTIRLFLEPLPIRLKYPDNKDEDAHMMGDHPVVNPTISTFIHALRKSSQDAVSNGISWDKLLHHLDIKPDYPNHPLFDVMVTFHEQNSALGLSIPGITPLYTWSTGAKFKLMVEMQVVNEGKVYPTT